jgi:hypothetical protein
MTFISNLRAAALRRNIDLPTCCTTNTLVTTPWQSSLPHWCDTKDG